MANHTITLDKTQQSDLFTFFEFQLDPEANHLAAFTATDSHNETAYIEKYSKFLNDPTINMKTIKLGGEIVGSISKFLMFGEAEITYWIDRKYWGQGIGSEALKFFLQTETTRPIQGRVAFDNVGSQRVLEKAGFVKVGEDKGFANARQEEIKEFIYELAE